MTRCWTSAPAELHSIVNTPSCLAQPRTSPSPCSSRRSDSDRTMWISSLPCECVDAVNGRGRRAIDFGKTSRARRWGRRHAADDIPGGGESRPTTARTGRRSPLGSPNHRSPSRVCGARVSVRMIRSRCEAHRSIARAKGVLGGRVRGGGGMPGAGRRARATCLFNDVQMVISQLLAARGAARHGRRRQSLDLGLGGVGRGPTPPEGRSPRGCP